MKKIFATLCLIIFAQLVWSQDLTGNWNGKLEVQPGKYVLFVIHLSQQGEQWNTKLSIPSQRLENLEVKKTTYEGGQLELDASNLGFSYSGKWKPESRQIEGHFKEGQYSKPLTFVREKLKEEQISRPQEPVKPYPYREEQVTFDNPQAHIRLSGTLTLPGKGTASYPAAVLISGSGPQDRDETFAGHKPFLVLADYLTRQGIAVLRFDDRGFGESGGKFEEATTRDFAQDVACAVQFLKSRAEIDPAKIGLIGHSEGGIIAPMVANETKDVAYVVMLAGTGLVGKEVSLIQAVALRTIPVEEEKYEAYVRKAIEIASADKEVETVKAELTEYYQKSQLLKSVLPSHADPDAVIRKLVELRTNPWMRYFYHYNPADEIRKLQIPALALYGSKDTQVPPRYHMKPVHEALKASKSESYEVIELENLNHLFQESETGSMAEYQSIAQTFAPEALLKIGIWISQQVGSHYLK